MQPKQVISNILPFSNALENQLNKSHALCILSDQINWDLFETEFRKLYSPNQGRPAKPIRLMVSLLILKHIRNLSDESVVEQWVENMYYQYFSGEKFISTKSPCEASELVHFRKRIGAAGMELILKESIRINGNDGKGDILSIDTTTQEKNITYPTDDKLYKKIIKSCKQIATENGIDLRQSYSRTIKKLGVDQRFRNSKKNNSKARKADRKIKTIAGRLLREIERKLEPTIMIKHRTLLDMYLKILNQKREDKNKIYSIHEPHVQCMSKGKAHKKYEYGNKVSILVTQGTEVIVGALSIEKNQHDSKTVEPALDQYKRLNEKEAKEVFADRGYRGKSQYGSTEIKVAGKEMNISKMQKRKHGRRAAIEPKIGHLKSDHRLGRNFYKGICGDAINVLLAAAAMNFKRMMNKWKTLIFSIFNMVKAILEGKLHQHMMNYRLNLNNQSILKLSDITF